MMTEAANAGRELWITQFDEEINDGGEGTCEGALAMMLKDFLLSSGDTTPAHTARGIDDLYTKEFLQSDPLMRFDDDQGLGSFLSSFYEVVFTLARLIPYNCSYHENLVRLILELRKLPPRQCRTWDEDCLLWTREPVFAVMMEDNWNGNHPSDAMERSGGYGKSSFQEVCTEWVNFSCFLARCIRAGLNDGYKDGCKYPIVDIAEGLEQNLPRGPKRDCKVMVAAQYILLAGRKVADECFTTPVRDFESDQWRRWAERFGEMSSQEGINTTLGFTAREAHKHMVSLRPEVFLAPQEKWVDVAEPPEQRTTPE